MSTLSVAELNALGAEEAELLLAACCRWPGWGRALARRRPFDDVADLCRQACDLLMGLRAAELSSVLALYPPLASVYAGGSVSEGWSRLEEAGIAEAPAEIRSAIAEDVARYRDHFGYTFLVSALGLSGADILGQLQRRLVNAPGDELETSREQLKIKSVRRLCRLVAD